MRQTIVELAQRIAGRLAKIEGVVAVALGGSWARGEAHLGSDLDLGIYYRDEHRPSIEGLYRLARELGYRYANQPVTDFGGWGPWINGGAWLRVKGMPVDWLYRELGRVSCVIDECKTGRPAVHYQPDHPHGFHTSIYMGEIYYCRPLHDPEGALGSLKNLTNIYPPRLRHALIRGQLWEARFALYTCRKAAARGDAFYVTGCLFRCAACMVQGLFALNERYLINEKGSVEAAGSLSLRPTNFKEIVDSVLARPGHRPEQLEGSVKRFENLVETVERLCVGPLHELDEHVRGQL